jgi:hypothetical protein
MSPARTSAASNADCLLLWSRITKYICSTSSPNLAQVLLDPASLASGIAAARTDAAPAAGQELKTNTAFEAK